MMKIVYVNFFTSNIIYGEYMARIWYEWKYCYTKFHSLQLYWFTSNLLNLELENTK